jgi:hypothetical protein
VLPRLGDLWWSLLIKIEDPPAFSVATGLPWGRSRYYNVLHKSHWVHRMVLQNPQGLRWTSSRLLANRLSLSFDLWYVTEHVASSNLHSEELLAHGSTWIDHLRTSVTTCHDLSQGRSAMKCLIYLNLLRLIHALTGFKMVQGSICWPQSRTATPNHRVTHLGWEVPLPAWQVYHATSPPATCSEAKHAKTTYTIVHVWHIHTQTNPTISAVSQSTTIYLKLPFYTSILLGIHLQKLQHRSGARRIQGVPEGAGTHKRKCHADGCPVPWGLNKHQQFEQSMSTFFILYIYR